MQHAVVHKIFCIWGRRRWWRWFNSYEKYMENFPTIETDINDSKNNNAILYGYKGEGGGGGGGGGDLCQNTLCVRYVFHRLYQ